MNGKTDKAKVNMKFKGFIKVDGDTTKFDLGFDIDLELEHIKREVVLKHIASAVLKSARNGMRNGRVHLASR